MMRPDVLGLPLAMGVIPCRFGDGPAVAIYRMSKGCVCFRDDRVQALCSHHEYKATPIGSMELL